MKINLKNTIEQTLFFSKWMLVPFYLGLIVALGCFMIIDLKEVWEYILEIGSLNKTSAMMFLLELIDMAMIAALVRMIIIGGYTSFVNKYHSLEGEKTSSGVLKVKLGTALIGVSSIHLLQSFLKCVSDTTITWDVLNKQMLIHCSFLLGAIVLAYVDYLHVKAEMAHITPEEQAAMDKHKEVLDGNSGKKIKNLLTEDKH